MRNQMFFRLHFILESLSEIAMLKRTIVWPAFLCCRSRQQVSYAFPFEAFYFSRSSYPFRFFEFSQMIPFNPEKPSQIWRFTVVLAIPLARRALDRIVRKSIHVFSNLFYFTESKQRICLFCFLFQETDCMQCASSYVL